MTATSSGFRPLPSSNQGNADELLAHPLCRLVARAGHHLLAAFRPQPGSPVSQGSALKTIVAEAQARLDAELREIWLPNQPAAPTAQALSGVHSYHIGDVRWLSIAGVDTVTRAGLAVAFQPAVGEWFIAQNGTTLWTNERIRIATRTRVDRELDGASLCIGDGLAHATDAEREAVATLASQVGLHQPAGTGYGMCLLALGQIDLMIDTDMSPQEAAVLGAIVRGAGGVLCDWQGHAPGRGRILAAASPALLVRALDCLQWDAPARDFAPASSLQ